MLFVIRKLTLIILLERSCLKLEILVEPSTLLSKIAKSLIILIYEGLDKLESTSGMFSRKCKAAMTTI